MSYDEITAPKRLPEPGFYYHYKHDPNLVRKDCPDAALRNYAYEVLPSFGLYTEEDGPEDLFRVCYIPLYPWAKVYQISRSLGRICEDHRPLALFLEEVTPGVPRFQKIKDPTLLNRLAEVRDEMYGIFPQ